MAFDLSDLGIEPPESAATLSGASAVENGHLEPSAGPRRGLVPNSALARTLYSVWSGQPVTIVDSPPGAGKTTLLVDLIIELLERTELTLVAAGFTKRSVAELASRLVESLEECFPDPSLRPLVWFAVSPRNYPTPSGCVSVLGEENENRRHIKFRTVASCVSDPPDCDVLIVDEGYQVTWSDLFSAADLSDQILTVGDPGQIGPVVSVDTRVWDQARQPPHRRAPEILAMRDDATVLRLDATYRLGQQTVDAIAPLYGFPFETRRLPRSLSTRQGEPLAELEQVGLDYTEDVADVATMRALADRAIDLSRMVLTETDRSDGVVRSRHMTDADVAVVVPHNVQVNSVSAILSANGHEEIAVGTADSFQGGQWHAVVALDPLVGHAAVGEFQLDEGRLCVIASRHMSHLSWVHDKTALDRLGSILREGDGPVAKAAKGIAVRRGLLGITGRSLTPLERDGF